MSLDDSVLVPANLMLLDNATNYSRAAIDYLNHGFKYTHDEVPLFHTLLAKLAPHGRVLRLPSCSMEDDADYDIYLHRLLNCLWRRWSAHSFKLCARKCDPLELNWHKETDVTVLYGPQLSSSCEVHTAPWFQRPPKDLCDDFDDVCTLTDDNATLDESSSTASSVFDRSVHFGPEVTLRVLDYDTHHYIDTIYTL